MAAFLTGDRRAWWWGTYVLQVTDSTPYDHQKEVCDSTQVTDSTPFAVTVDVEVDIGQSNVMQCNDDWPLQARVPKTRSSSGRLEILAVAVVTVRARSVVGQLNASGSTVGLLCLVPCNPISTSRVQE